MPRGFGGRAPRGTVLAFEAFVRRALTGLLLVGPLLAQGWSLASRLPTPPLFVALDADFARQLRDVLPGSTVARVLRESGCAVPAEAFALLGRVTDLCQGTMEIALGAQDGAVIVHCELPEAAARRLQAVIDDDALVERVSEADGTPIVALRAERGQGGAPALHLALVEGHLVVGSTHEAVRKLLLGAPAQHTLAADDDFRELSRRIDAGRQALTVFGSWEEISASIARLLPAERVGRWFAFAGAIDARSFLLAVRPTGEGLVSTVLLRPADAAALHERLAPLQRVPPAALAADLPRGGVGGLAFAFDLDAVAKGQGERLALLWKDLTGCRADAGAAIEQQLLQRLAGVATVQMVRTDAGVVPAYLARAKSERDAQRVLDDCQRFARGRPGVDAQRASPGSGELLLPTEPGMRGQPRLGIVRDRIVLASAEGVIDEVVSAERDVRWAAQALKHLPGGQRPVVALVVFDLDALLAEPPAQGGAFARHAGCIRVFPDHVRLELLSQS